MSDEKVEVIFGKGTAKEFIPNWTSLVGRKSLDELCHYIEIETDVADRKRIAKHMKFGIYYSRTVNKGLSIVRKPVLTGLVDNVDLESSSKRSSFKFNGRSAARNIVDSKWSDTIKGKTLFGVVKAIGSKFGIECAMLGTGRTDTTAVIEEFAFENESPWELVQQEAANQGFLVTSNQIGGLYVWKLASGQNEWGFTVKEGENITSFKDSESGSNQFYKYILKADGIQEEGKDDTCLDTTRVLTLNLPDRDMKKEKLKRRVETEIRRRRERRISVGLASWALPSELIEANSKRPGGNEIFWELNFLTPVQIPTLGIKDNLITSQVEYRADKASMSCDVQLSNPKEYS